MECLANVFFVWSWVSGHYSVPQMTPSPAGAHAAIILSPQRDLEVALGRYSVSGNNLTAATWMCSLSCAIKERNVGVQL